MHTVCHVITKLELGGAQEVALHLVGHLSRERYRPILVTGPRAWLTEEARSLPGVELIEVSALRREIRPLADLRAFLELIALFRRLRPSIVHTHSSKAGILGRWAAWVARVPTIVHTIHGYGITPAQSPWLRNRLISVERATGKITTHWIAVSKEDIHRGLEWALFKREDVTLIRAGIDPAPFLKAREGDRDAIRREWGWGPDVAIVGSVACLKPQKAPADFLAVAGRVIRSIPNAKFVLIGDGEERAKLERAIEGMQLQGSIKLLGWRRDVPRLLHAFDAFLLTSRWEGLPRVLLEARVAGLPIVATKVGGAHEAVVPGKHGWLCEPGDVPGLAGRVRQVLAEHDRPHRVVRADADELPKEFHLSHMVEQHERLYASLLEPGGAAVEQAA